MLHLYVLQLLIFLNENNTARIFYLFEIQNVFEVQFNLDAVGITKEEKV